MSHGHDSVLHSVIQLRCTRISRTCDYLESRVRSSRLYRTVAGEIAECDSVLPCPKLLSGSHPLPRSICLEFCTPPDERLTSVFSSPSRDEQSRPKEKKINKKIKRASTTAGIKECFEVFCLTTPCTHTREYMGALHILCYFGDLEKLRESSLSLPESSLSPLFFVFFFF